MGSPRQVLENGQLEARPGAAAPLHGQGIQHRRIPEQQVGGSLLSPLNHLVTAKLRDDTSAWKVMVTAPRQ